MFCKSYSLLNSVVTFVHMLIIFIIQQWHIKVFRRNRTLWKPLKKSVDLLELGMSWTFVRRETSWTSCVVRVTTEFCTFWVITLALWQCAGYIWQKLPDKLYISVRMYHCFLLNLPNLHPLSGMCRLLAAVD
jgi:hypothetical protein